MKNNWLTITADAKSNTTTIDIEGTIGGDWWSDIPAEQQATKENIKNAFKEIAAVKGDKLIININSLGGDVNHGLSIHDLLAQNAAHKTVRINGMTASAATVIAMAGDVVEMSDNALFLVHRASTIVWGNAEEMASMIEDLKKIDNLLAKIYSKRTGKTVEDVLAQMDKNVTGEWMTADEAKEFGFVDKVFEPTKMAATVDKIMFAKAGLPEIPTDKLTKTKIEMSETAKTPEKEASLFDSFLNRIKNGFKNEDSKGLTEEQIDAKIKSIAEAQAKELSAEFENKVNSIKEENEKAKTDLVNAHTEAVNAKQVLIDELTNSNTKLENELRIANEKISTLEGKETPAEGSTSPAKDLNIDNNKKKKAGYLAAADENAKILRSAADSNREEEEEEEEGGENK